MPAARVSSIEFLSPASAKAAGENAGVQVRLEDGSLSAFLVATPGRPALGMKKGKKDYAFGAPMLFVKSLDQEAVGEAVVAMAERMSGYWLRYYNSSSRQGAKAKALQIVSAAVTEAYPPRKSEEACGVVQARIADGREFSLLTATPSWFERSFENLGLRYYFGPSILFVKKLDLEIVRRAVKAMAADGDRWLCLYDTPRTTLPEILAQFEERQTS